MRLNIGSIARQLRLFEGDEVIDINTDSTSEIVSETVDYNKMTLPVLKALVVEKGILEDASKMPNLIAELLRRGYTDDDIAKICYMNTFRVWRAVEEYAKNVE